MNPAQVTIHIHHVTDAPEVWTSGTVVGVEVAGVTIFVDGGVDQTRALAAALSEAADMADRIGLPAAA